MSRNKIAVSISREQLEAFLADLKKLPGVDGPMIRKLAAERFDLDVGHGSANDFRKNIFEKYLQRLSKQRESAQMIAENIAPDGSSVLGGAISQWVGTEIFDQLIESGLEIDVKTEEGLATAECIARIAERLSRNDVRTRKLIQDAEESARAKEKARLEKELSKRAGAGGGLSAEAVEAMRAALGWSPPKEFAAPDAAQGDPARTVSEIGS